MSRAVSRAVIVLVLAVGFAAPAQSPKDATLVHPIIPHVGGVLLMPKAAEQPRKGAKMVIDITADEPIEAVHKGLKRAALVLNLYGAAGLKASDVKIAIVFHGKATRCVLRDAAFREKFQSKENPNLPVIQNLQAAGVEVFVCGQALGYSGFKESDVADGIQTALAAVLLVVNRQNDGYAYIPVP